MIIFNALGIPNSGLKSKVEWVRPIFESVVTAMQGAMSKPFKVAFLGPAQQSVIVDDQPTSIMATQSNWPRTWPSR